MKAVLIFLACVAATVAVILPICLAVRSHQLHAAYRTVGTACGPEKLRVFKHIDNGGSAATLRQARQWARNCQTGLDR